MTNIILRNLVVFLAVIGLSLTSVNANTPNVIVITNPSTNKSFKFVDVAVDNLNLLKEKLDKLGMSEHLFTLQGIMLVETRAGVGGSIGLPKADWTRRSYGLMQITVPTARVFLQRYPDVAQKYIGNTPVNKTSNEKIIKLLLHNKEANIHLGALVFKVYLDMVDGEWARAVAAYNMGIGNALRRPYAPKVKYVKDVREMMGFAKGLNEHLTKSVVPATVITPFVSDVVSDDDNDDNN